MINFRHLKHKDLNDVRDYICDPNVTKYLTWNTYVNEEEINKYMCYATTCVKFPDEILAIVFGGKVIGTAHMIMLNDGVTQIGFGIQSKYWNRGIGKKQ